MSSISFLTTRQLNEDCWSMMYSVEALLPGFTCIVVLSLMSNLIPTTRRPRQGTRYSREELVVMSRYKAEYKEQTTKALRAHVFRTKILVDMFNYWDKEGTLPLEDESCTERVKVYNSDQ
jgi:hypothetical protein